MLIDDIKNRGILIVDDEAYILNLLEETLKQYGYTNIYKAKGGTEALSLLEANGGNIYVVVLDIRMPKIDGFSVIKHLTNVHVYHVGIIMLTAFASKEYEKTFKDNSSQFVMPLNLLRKPCDDNELIKEIRFSCECVHKKRISLFNVYNQPISEWLEKIENKICMLDELSNKITQIEKKQHGFFYNLGINLLILVAIGFAVLAALFLGIDDFVKKIIH